MPQPWPRSTCVPGNGPIGGRFPMPSSSSWGRPFPSASGRGVASWIIYRRSTATGSLSTLDMWWALPRPGRARIVTRLRSRPRYWHSISTQKRSDRVLDGPSSRMPWQTSGSADSDRPRCGYSRAMDVPVAFMRRQDGLQMVDVRARNGLDFSSTKHVTGFCSNGFLYNVEPNVLTNPRHTEIRRSGR